MLGVHVDNFGKPKHHQVWKVDDKIRDLPEPSLTDGTRQPPMTNHLLITPMLMHKNKKPSLG